MSAGRLLVDSGSAQATRREGSPMPRTTLLRTSPRPMARRIRLISAFTLLMGLTAGFTGAAAQGGEDAAGSGVTTLTGSLQVTNPFVLEILTEPFVLLNDLTNFVERELDGPLPEFLQVTARLEGDLDAATYMLALPIAPQATVNDVDQGEGGDGVHVYAVDLQANVVGDPFVEPIEGGGWATTFTSAEVALGTNEITGGRLVVWAPDDEQAFPTGFGDDGRLFTDDDPIAPIPAGWTVVDLDEAPFEKFREPIVEVNIREGDGGLRDLSNLSFLEAFDALVDELRLRYPFTEYKAIDWDAIVAEYRPRIERADDEGDFVAFQIAMMRFAVDLRDGHVYVDPNGEYLIAQFLGGLGITIGETDDGQVIVTDLAGGGPAAEAGVELGATVVEWNGEPVEDAIEATELIFPSSSPHTTRLQQLSLLPRGEVGDGVSLSYANSDGGTQTVELRFVDDFDGLIDAFGGDDVIVEMPVTVELLPSGLGYIRVNTFADDLVLMTHAWEWAIDELNAVGAPGLIVDVRGNAGGSGGLPTYFAGSFYDDKFELAESRFATESGEFVPNGKVIVEPAPVQWNGPVAVLIDENCASACEIFAAAMAADADHLIVGQYPTAGVEASVYPWLLPGDLFFQAPLEYLEADGGVWIEGVGVPPTVEVPVTAENLLGDEDVVLEAAETALGA
jgi:C-terminal processing protease CtpA/Prc